MRCSAYSIHWAYTSLIGSLRGLRVSHMYWSWGGQKYLGSVPRASPEWVESAWPPHLDWTSTGSRALNLNTLGECRGSQGCPIYVSRASTKGVRGTQPSWVKQTQEGLDKHWRGQGCPTFMHRASIEEAGDTWPLCIEHTPKGLRTPNPCASGKHWGGRGHLNFTH